MTTIKDTIGVVLMLSLSATVACNSKSPETTDDSSEVGESTKQAAEKPAEPVEPPRPDPLPTLDGPHMSAFDLADNRPLAHVLRGEALVVDAGQPDFVRYVHGDHPGHWELEREIEGRKAAALDRRRDSSIWLPAV